MGELVRMPTRDGFEPLVNARQLATHFGVVESTVRRWRAAGMPSYKSPRGARRYKLSEAERYLRDGAG